MSSQPRSVGTRVGSVALVVAMLSVIVTIPVSAATEFVSGTLTFTQKLSLSGKAVAIITVVDQAAAPDAGAVIGQQRIDGVAAVPVPFSVPYDPARVNAKHAYGLYATIVDGSKTWQNPQGIAVLTGGPTSGIDALLTAVPAPAATITGTITESERTTLSSSAVVIAALIKQETGTLVSRQVQPISGQTPVSFTIGFDPSVIDPDATYVVKGGIVDGGTVWENRQGVPAITGGTAASTVTLPVTRAPAPIPAPTPAPTEAPSASAAPSGSAAPSAHRRPDREAERDAQAERHSRRRRPSRPPRRRRRRARPPRRRPTPTPTATATPTPTPTPTPTATPTVDPERQRRQPTATPQVARPRRPRPARSPGPSTTPSRTSSRPRPSPSSSSSEARRVRTRARSSRPRSSRTRVRCRSRSASSMRTPTSTRPGPTRSRRASSTTRTCGPRRRARRSSRMARRRPT